ncbi:hypothetical protein Vadar_034700 [Vaccinium darrowii]|uniref:Uncharacterized protein n=1 Tax=Vaccinium darrowii TaxID=229202 RepID=A0ACB7XM07_9ERIC|nr:hypothetical protein Vadar_034700 [Vaccinium darrowii]
MTPSSVSYLLGTPGGQPMTPENGGLDVMSPVVDQGSCGIQVNAPRSGEDSVIGVVREVLPEVQRLLLGFNCGRAIVPISLPDPARALTAKRDFDLQGKAGSSFVRHFRLQPQRADELADSRADVQQFLLCAHMRLHCLPFSRQEGTLSMQHCWLVT